MKNNLQFVLAYNSISLYKAGIFIKKIQFCSSGIRPCNTKSKLDFTFKVIKSIIESQNIDGIIILLDSTYFENSEHVEFQEKGNVTDLDGLKSGTNVVANSHRYFNESSEIKNLDKISRGQRYFELLSIYSWKPIVLEVLVKPLSLLFENLHIKPLHDIYVSSEQKNSLGLIVDFSLNHTLVSIYESDYLLKADCLNIGISNLFVLISEKFAIPIDLAQKLYSYYGMLVTPHNYSEVVIDVPLNEYIIREVPLTELSNLIQIFYEKLYNSISELLQIQNLELSKLLLTGIGHDLYGLESFTKLRFNSNISIISLTNSLNNYLQALYNEIDNNIKNESGGIQHDESKEQIGNTLEKQSISNKIKGFVLGFLSDTDSETDAVFA